MADSNDFRVTEQVTWIGWSNRRDAIPRVDTVSTFFNKNWQATTFRDVLMQRAHDLLVSRRFIRLQLMGYSRLDKAEWNEIDAFLEMAYYLKLLPNTSQIAHTVAVRNPDELGLDGKPLKWASENVVLRDSHSVGVHEPDRGRRQGSTFHLIMADLVTLDGLADFHEAFRKFTRI